MPLFPRGERMSKTHDELFILGWFNRAVLGQALNDCDGTVELCLSVHCRLSR